MRFNEIKLVEDPVDSSWIEDLAYDESSDGVIMSLNNGNQYLVNNMSEDDFMFWLQSDSKGKHWHTYIRDLHNVDRLF